MAQYQLSFESYTLGAYPSELTRRWATTQASPTVVAVDPAVLGVTKALGHTGTANSRQLDSINAIDADADRATVKFRCLVYSGGDISGFTTASPLFTAVVRASGAAGSETGYAFTLYKTTTTYTLGLNRYSSGSLTTFGHTQAAWVSGTWYVVEGEVSGTSEVVLTYRIYAVTDLTTPITTYSYTDSSASRIETPGWVGVGRFANNAITRIGYVNVATGASDLAIDPWDAAPDTTAPTLTSPSATATGATTASGSVTTDTAEGTLHYLASANATELVATVKAGSSQAVTAIGAQPVTITGLTASTPYYLHFVHTDAAANDSAVATSTQFTTDAETVAIKGATITLYNGATPQASLTDLRVLWWDATAPDGTAPDYYSATESTDVAGVLSIDLDAVTTLAVGDYGYLHVHKAGTLGNAYQDALVFSGAIQVQDIS